MNRLKKRSIKMVAEMLASEVMAWGDELENAKEDIVLQISEALSYNFSDKYSVYLDGFLLACYLKKHYEYRPDTELVNILDKAHDLYKASFEHLLIADITEVKSRITQSDIDNISSQYKKGDKVKLFSSKLNKEIIGIITNIFNFGKAEIYCPELGHCNPFDETDEGNGEGIWGILVDIDKITKAD